MKHNRKYLQAKYVVENPSEYDYRDVIDAKTYCNAYNDGIEAFLNKSELKPLIEKADFEHEKGHGIISCETSSKMLYILKQIYNT